METLSCKPFSRRAFAKAAGAAGLAAIAGAHSAKPLYAAVEEGEDAAASSDATVWNVCRNWGCGGTCCPIRFHVENGIIQYVEPDNTVEDGEDGMFQNRACLRGRSIRRFVNHPDRLKYPLKRVGKRGSGEFERISWDEAIDILEEKLRYTIETYGNEAIFSNMSAADGCINDRPFERLLNLLGGYLNAYGTDSCGCIKTSIPYTYGSLAHVYDGSSILEARNSDLVIMFGNSPATSRMSGGGAGYGLDQVRAAGAEIINIDPRMNESCSGHPEEWQPIRIGTDAALVEAMCHVLITEGYVDEEWVNAYCLGYDDDHMPEGAPANASYKSYIMGLGEDGVEKTPEWAEPITQIPAERIYELARKLGNAKAAFIVQGWGPQRRANGENTSRAIPMLAILSGNIGRPGTNSGVRESDPGGDSGYFTGGENPVKTAVSLIHRIEIIERGHEMTALADGVQNADRLSVDCKFMWNHECNILANQNPDINHAIEVLKDESKCEFIATCDVFMTESAKYSDLVLPDATRQEKVWVSNLGSMGGKKSTIFCRPAQEPQFEVRDIYDVCVELADRFGLKDEYSLGRTWEDWNRALWDEARAANPDLPTYDEGMEMGVYSRAVPIEPALAAYFDEANPKPFETKSGKIEIYSSDLADIAQRWELPDKRDKITPLPVYFPGYESYEDVTDEYPLLLSSWHAKAAVHSTFRNIDVIKKAVEHVVWINPIDAQAREIENDEVVAVTSPRGTLHIPARVTTRIMPGHIAMEEGAWHDADMEGDKIDKGGNINTLVSHHWTPLAKHNSSNSNIANVEKI